MLVGFAVGLLGMHPPAATSQMPPGSIHIWPLAIIAGETMIVVGLILLAWALIRFVVSALAAR